MALSVTRENYVMHRIHSITGVMPVGYYMVQHLVLNFNSVFGPEKFNGVIEFFEGLPKPFLLALEVGMIWLPLLFHAVYGLFIISRAENNYLSTKYKWSHNKMFFLQRVSGIVVFFYLIYHSITTTGAKYLSGSAEGVKYAGMSEKLHNPIVLAIYVIGILAASYHLGYGIWNFCIRWGITVKEDAQVRVQKLSAVIFVALTLLGWGALGGFFLHSTKDQPNPPVTHDAGGTNIKYSP